MNEISLTPQYPMTKIKIIAYASSFLRGSYFHSMKLRVEVNISGFIETTRRLVSYDA